MGNVNAPLIVLFGLVACSAPPIVESPVVWHGSTVQLASVQVSAGIGERAHGRLLAWAVQDALREGLQASSSCELVSNSGHTDADITLTLRLTRADFRCRLEQLEGGEFVCHYPRVSVEGVLVVNDARTQRRLATIEIDPRPMKWTSAWGVQFDDRGQLKGFDDDSYTNLGSLFEKGPGFEPLVTSDLNLFENAAVLVASSLFDDLGLTTSAWGEWTKDMSDRVRVTTPIAP